MKYDYNSKVRLYLMGGIGNILFQIDHGTRNSSDNQRIVFVTNLIESKFYSRIFGWTYHNNALKNYTFTSPLIFERVSFFQLILDLFKLWLFKKKIFLNSGVSWESFRLTKINFGYFQYERDLAKRNLVISNDFVEIDIPVVHLRLGDSPTLNQDKISQIKLMRSLTYKKYLVITNDANKAKEFFSEENYEVLIQSNSQQIDFFILANCKIIIIPQSTFSWMAAYENTNLEKIYVHQKLWSKLWFNTSAEIVTYN